MNSFACSVPMPPSVNAMFATDFKTRRRFVTKEYSAWRDAARLMVKVAWQKQGSPKFDKGIQLTLHMGLNYKSDIDNRIKPILDLLDKSIPDFPNDRYIDRIEVERVPGIDGVRMLIMQRTSAEVQ